MLVNSKEKDLQWQNVECSCTFKHTENFLEHWTTFAYNIDSKTSEKEIAVCTTHHKKFKLPAFFIKSYLKYSCFQYTFVNSSNFTLFLIYFMFA
jgi:hypothetical protein